MTFCSELCLEMLRSAPAETLAWICNRVCISKNTSASQVSTHVVSLTSLSQGLFPQGLLCDVQCPAII